ncbi:hypothetical protein EMPS_06472 [Entomortierella parvispora]|uniref:Mitochondrial carrier protein n=1 Tax=Entomortierella parvispora TaxID=205924 RepID=A0A9P3HCE9_9FUNG|nr:hypothetical protein EMPS_06472 [Entomortierella parvispora]
MPTDVSTNLATSAAAAFCARLCIHPLDHLKASLPGLEGLTVAQSSSRRIYEAVHRHLSLLHQDHPRQQQQEKLAAQSRIRKQHSQHHQTLRERIQFWRGLYKGVPFALLVNVPALAFFLSTYDATKHGLAYLSTEWNISRFHLHHFETHLISGMAAKAAGTILWAPMTQLQTMQARAQGQPVAVAGTKLSLRDAYGLIKRMARSAEGLKGLWSRYGSTLTSLLPYTMLYFATYEQLKQLARWVIVNRSGSNHGSSKDNGSSNSYGDVAFGTIHETPFPLDLGTYMVCVSGAVAISAAVCHSVSALRIHLLEILSQNSTPLLEQAKSTIATPSATSPTSVARSSMTLATAVLSPPQTHHTLLTGAHLSSKLQSQHAHLTTTATATATATNSRGTATMLKPLPQQQTTYIRRPLLREPALTTLDATKATTTSSTASSSTGRFWRQMTRGLGPRILWTAPGVTLTTAGFEVFRNMALGVV